MTEEPRPVLPYQPAPKRWKRRNGQLALLILTLLVAGGLAAWQLRPRAPAGPVFPTNSPTVTLVPGNLRSDTNAIEVPYGKWLLFRDANATFALRIAKGSADPIRYELVHLTGGAAGAPVPTTATTREATGWARISVGQGRLIWSQGGIDGGWIYWSNSYPNLAVSSRTLDDLADLKIPDPGERWYTRQGVAKLAGHTAPLPSTPQ